MSQSGGYVGVKYMIHKQKRSLRFKRTYSLSGNYT